MTKESTVTVTQTSTTTAAPAVAVTINRGYHQTLHGKLNIALLILNLICLICIGSGYYFRGSGWYYFVASSGFTTELLVLLFAIFSCTDRIQGITIVRSHLLALIFCGLWCFFYLTAASAVLNVAINFSGLDGLYAAVIFGFITMIIYGYQFYLHLQVYRGTRVVVTTTATA